MISAVCGVPTSIILLSCGSTRIKGNELHGYCSRGSHVPELTLYTVSLRDAARSGDRAGCCDASMSTSTIIISNIIGAPSRSDEFF